MTPGKRPASNMPSSHRIPVPHTHMPRGQSAAVSAAILGGALSRRGSTAHPAARRSCARGPAPSVPRTGVGKHLVGRTDGGRTIMTPQRSMSSESQTDGRSRLRNTFDGTSKMAYEKKNIVSAMRYCWSVIPRSLSIWYSCNLRRQRTPPPPPRWTPTGSARDAPSRSRCSSGRGS